MLAIGLNNYGGPEVLQLLELPDPHPTAGQVRVRVHSAGINPVDVMVREGLLDAWFADAPRPFVPGMDISGVIDEIGEDVDPAHNIRIGQPVSGLVNNFGGYGGYSQYVCLPAESVVEIPPGVDFPAAASFLMNALTARNALDRLGLGRDSTVLVTGAAGGVGTYAVELGSADGLRIVAQAGSQDAQALLACGADKVIARGEGAVERVLELFPSGVDAAIDAAGLGDTILPAVKDGGTIVVLRPANDNSLERGISRVFVNVRDRSRDIAAMRSIAGRLASGKLSLRVAATFPARDAIAAHRRFDAGHLRGRVILNMEEFS